MMQRILRTVECRAQKIRTSVDLPQKVVVDHERENFENLQRVPEDTRQVRQRVCNQLLSLDLLFRGSESTRSQAQGRSSSVSASPRAGALHT